MRKRSILLLSSLAVTVFGAIVACTGDSPPTTSDATDAATHDGATTKDGSTTPPIDGSVPKDGGGNTTDGTAPAVDSGIDAGPITTQLGARLVLWLVAENGVGSDAGTFVWSDKSAASNDAVQSDPTQSPVLYDGGSGINGHAVVHFDGALSFLQIADNASLQWGASDYTLFAVSRETVGATYAYIYGKFTNTGAFPGPFLWSSYPGFDGYVTRTDINNAIYSDAGYNDGVARVAGMRRAGADLQLHISGTEVADLDASTIADEAGFNAATIPAYIGGRPDHVQQLNGDIAEIIGVKGVVTDAELAQIQAYLKAKYGL